ncbi:MAG: H-X9-DG-CTERM domain-containing protein, partial [Planctomycetia bacterium]
TGQNMATARPTLADTITSPNRVAGAIDPQGMFNTCLTAPVAVNNFNFSSPGRWLVGEDFSNGWHTASYSGSMYNHMATPNWTSIDCGNWSAIADAPGEHMIMSARSYHTGGVNVVFGDGTVAFIGDSIDRSVYQALGTRDGEESNHAY